MNFNYSDHSKQISSFEGFNQSVTATLEELQHLQEFVPDQFLSVSLRYELEALREELTKLDEQTFSESGLHLQVIHEQKLALKKIALAIETALIKWEQSLESFGHIDIVTESELIKEYGYKHGRLIEQSEYLRMAKLPGVEVPTPKGISNSQLHKFLNLHCPEIPSEWEMLNEGFIAFQKTKETGQSDASYLQLPLVKETLKKIERSIFAAFEKAATDTNIRADLSLSEDIIIWLDQLKMIESYLMVRSSGAEDTCQASNAGGNLSVSYVEPQLEPVCHALGAVVASYFGEASLQNRLNSEQNPFAESQHLAVCLQELIGETVIERGTIDSTDQSQIPISLVLFSNEPTYVGDEPFRIMRISATFGHGEGVVGTVGVRCDTFTLLKSVKHPERLYILEDISVKPKRLAPVKDGLTGKIQLQKIDNPYEIAHKASLDKRLLTQLFYLGVRVEKIYNHPMDMEIVIKQGKIYLVQARPVNRPVAHPTFLDLKKVDRLVKENNQTHFERLCIEPFLPGVAQAQILSKTEELLIRDTLEIAEKQFKKALNRLVVIKQEESANTHPVVNFSGMGIPVMYSEDQEPLKQLALSIDGFRAMIACVQTGQILVLPEHLAKNCISDGYTVHPARIAISVNHQLLPLVFATEKGELPKEISSLLLKIRALEGQEQALSALRELKETLNAAIGLKKEWLAKKLELDPHLPRGKNLKQGIGSWEKVMAGALSVFKKAIKVSPENRLQLLFHANLIEVLTTQKTAPQTLGRLSYLNIDEHLKAVSKIADYRSKFDEFSHIQFSEEILLCVATMTKGQEKQWEQFLTTLEYAYKKELISKEEVMQFRQMLQQLSNLSLLPIWMARFFLPAVDREPLSLEQAKTASTVMKQLLMEFPANASFLNQLKDFEEEIFELKENICQFSTPDKFEQCFKQLKTVCQPFITQGQIPSGEESIYAQIKELPSVWKQQMESATPLERIVAIELMGKLVELYDSAIKSMKGSLSYSDEEKTILFQKLLQGYFYLQCDWLIHLAGDLLQYHKFWPLEKYLCEMATRFASIKCLPSMLKASQFNVSAGVIGNQSAFERAFPVRYEDFTYEDFFTLNHQNLLRVIQALLEREMADKTIFPSVMEKNMTLINDVLVKEFEEPIQLTGCTFNFNQIILHYNYPLRNHSAAFSLTFCKESQQCMLEVFFLGQARTRWDNIGSIIQLYHDTREVRLKKSVKINHMELTYSLSMKRQLQAKKSLILLKHAAKDTMGDSSTELLEAIEKDQIIEKMHKDISGDALYKYLKRCPSTFSKLPDELKNDSFFLVRSVPFSNWSSNLKQEFGKDKQLFVEVLKKDGLLLQRVDEPLRDDESVLIAVTQNGAALMHATNTQQNNEKIVLAAVTQKGWTISLASENLQKKRAIVLAAVASEGSALQSVLEEFQDDLEIVLTAVKGWGLALEHASKRLQNSETVVLAAVSGNGTALKFANPQQQNNEKVVLAAVRRHGEALKFASNEQKNNEKVVLEATQNNPHALEFASDKQKNNEKLILAIVKKNYLALKFASDEQKNNEKVVLEAIENGPWALEYVGPIFQDNERIVMMAIKKNLAVLQFASERIRNKLCLEDPVLAENYSKIQDTWW